jgi:trans-aconitate 2-methyltransferase
LPAVFLYLRSAITQPLYSGTLIRHYFIPNAHFFHNYSSGFSRETASALSGKLWLADSKAGSPLCYDTEMMNEEKHAYQWDAEDYSQSSAQQKKWGRELLSKLRLEGGERVLDIGCGDGKITAEIAELLPQGHVVGIDSSEEMINFARDSYPRDRRPNLDWAVMDARELAFDAQFDLVFSNAVLHWIPDHKPVLGGIKRSLKPGGKILLQMGGRGNAGKVVEAMGKRMMTDQWNHYFHDMSIPYSFYGPEEYEEWLAEAGLTPLRVELVYKDMVHPGRDGTAAWIRTTWLPFTQRIPEDMRETFIYEIVDAYMESHPADEEGLVHVEAIRLEVEAENRG